MLKRLIKRPFKRVASKVQRSFFSRKFCVLFPDESVGVAVSQGFKGAFEVLGPRTRSVYATWKGDSF